MKFTLTMDCDNAAFTEDGPAFEIARILHAVAERCEAGHTDAGVLRDINGNDVGRYRMDD